MRNDICWSVFTIWLWLHCIPLKAHSWCRLWSKQKRDMQIVIANNFPFIDKIVAEKHEKQKKGTQSLMPNERVHCGSSRTEFQASTCASRDGFFFQRIEESPSAFTLTGSGHVIKTTWKVITGWYKKKKKHFKRSNYSRKQWTGKFAYAENVPTFFRFFLLPAGKIMSWKKAALHANEKKRN